MDHVTYINQEKHLVAVDCVIFGYEEGELKLLLFKRQLEPDFGKYSLVGGWIHQNESAEQAAERILQKITGLDNIFMEQVQVFSKPNRDPGGRVLSIVYYALIDIKIHDKKRTNQYGAEWFSINNIPQLIFDHQEMYCLALNKLRTKASYDIVGKDLLPKEFTLIQLRQLYNSIFGRDFDPGNFRKKIVSLSALNRLDKKDTSESKKGAYYYVFKTIDEIDISVRIVNI
ncbi:MAG: NUDIX domain-containing protein [Salinivirgaceae bacterium]|jgi:8-oxo-dGTP diphosphatase|nr:NUDIX domain-containing protein [Salinivirgaceae bacterium]